MPLQKRVLFFEKKGRPAKLPDERSYRTKKPLWQQALNSVDMGCILFPAGMLPSIIITDWGTGLRRRCNTMNFVLLRPPLCSLYRHIQAGLRKGSAFVSLFQARRGRQEAVYMDIHGPAQTNTTPAGGKRHLVMTLPKADSFKLPIILTLKTLVHVYLYVVRQGF